jgi:hypothetical protein
MYPDVTTQSARDAEGMDLFPELDLNALLCNLKKLAQSNVIMCTLLFLSFQYLMWVPAIQLDKCVADS